MKNTMNKKYRVAIYLRLSNEDQDKINHSESIKNQRNLLLDEISKRSDYILVDEYCDEDLSGAGTYRPEFERLIKDCELGKIDIILCKSQSRFSRDMEIIEKYLHNKFIEWNVRFISLSDHADTNNYGNKKARQINGLVNEWYLEDVSNNIRSAFYTKMKQGEFISPFAPFGYTISKTNNNKLVIDKNASLIVKNIFYLYLKGYGYSTIAKYLNHLNIPSPSYYKYLHGIKLNINSTKPRNKIKWNPNAIKTILTNEVYLGHLVQGKRTTISYKNHKIITNDKSKWIKTTNKHEAIIDENIFNQVQNIIARKTKPQKKTGTKHIFTGKVKCLECGKIMRKKTSKNHEYLVCSGYETNICKNKYSIRYDILENIILKYINQKIDTYCDKFITLNKPSRQKKLNNLNQLKLETKKNINHLKNNFRYLYEDKINKIITLKQFQELNTLYQEKESLYKKELNNINNKINKIKLTKSSYQIKHFNKLNNIIIDTLISNILIGPIKNKTREIQIHWNY